MKIFSFYEEKRNKSYSEKGDLILIFTEDILYSFIVCIFMLILVYGYNYGEIRLFSVIGTILGFYVWRITIGNVIIYLCEYCLYFISVLLFYVLFPFTFLIRKIKKVIYKSINLLYNISVRQFFIDNDKQEDVLPNKTRKILFNTIYMVKR